MKEKIMPDTDEAAIHTPPPITGYRNLTQAEVDLMNEGKALGVQIGQYIDRVSAMDGVDRRWVAIGTTHLQQGLMAVLRGIARPTTF
jgi:hypothetical protein